MGTDAHLVVVGGPPGLAALGRAEVDRLERLWSRFRADSEVSELNRRAGSPVRVSAETIELVARAIDGWWLSGGAFDPTVLGAVLRSGYDRSYELLGPESARGSSPLGIGASDIVIDDGTVRLPAGVGFDPGGIGKGLAADLVVAGLLDAGAEGVCVNLGGDVTVAGAGPGGDAWTVAVEHEWAANPVALLGLSAGAVATSTTLRRRWGSEGDERHHLIDPRTGLPSESDLNHVTVVAATAWVAEVLAKAVLLRGSEHPFDILGGTGAEALAVTTAGDVLSTPGLGAYLGGAEVPVRLIPARGPRPATAMG
jgi:thiamine biosynthesis lipoprotein